MVKRQHQNYGFSLKLNDDHKENNSHENAILLSLMIVFYIAVDLSDHNGMF